MKKIITLLLGILTFASCTKAPINGKLEGFWQLKRIETATDTIATRQYWSFQLRLLQLDRGFFYCRFDYKGNELHVYDIVAGEANSYIDKGGEIEAPINEADLTFLHKYGIFSLDTRFKIECIDDESMRLRSDDACLHFRKY